MKPRRISFTLPPIAAALSLIAGAAHKGMAADRTWDGGGANANWNTILNWDNDALPAATDNIIFGQLFGSGTTVSLAGNRTANSLTIDSQTSFSIANSTLVLTSGNITRTADSSGNQIIKSILSLGGNGVWNINGSGTLNVNSDLESLGAFGFTKNGTGTLILSGVTGQDGVSTINAGNVIFSGTVAAGGGGSGDYVFNGGTITFDYSANINRKLDVGQNLTLGGATLIKSGGTITETALSTTIASGASTFTRPGGTGTLRMNTVTRNAGGTLNLGASGIADADGTITVNSIVPWATVNGSDWATKNTGNDGALTAYTGYTTSLPASGSHSTVNFSVKGSASITGNLDVNSLKLNTTGAGEALTITGGAALTLSGNGLLFTGADDYSISGGSMTAGNGVGSYEIIAHQYGAGNLTIQSAITDNGANAVLLTKTGTGLLTLSGANTYSGPTTVNQGTLSISSNDNLGAPAAGSAVNLDGGTLQATGTFAMNNAGANDRAVTLAEKGGTIDVTAANQLTVSGIVSGPGGLVKTGSGTLALSGANTYAGSTTVSGGSLLLGASDVIPDSSAVTLNGGTLAMGNSGFDDSAGVFSLTSGSVIDMGSGGSILTFLSTNTDGWTGLLKIYNWSGIANLTGGSDQIHFTTYTGGSTSFSSSQVQFYSDSGLTAIGSGAALYGTELVAVPETETVVGALVLIGLAGWRERRHFLRCPEARSANAAS